MLETRLSPPAPDGGKPNRPLDGVTVLDLSWHLAGPFCTMILADLGARVIKVEPPGSQGGYDPGGIIRHRYQGTDLHYISVNRSKQSLTLDLKSPDGLADFYRLAAQCDVVFNNFRPGVMDRLKLDYETLKRHNPAVIYASISSFGSTGPERLRPGVDLVLQAMSGGMSMTGYPGERPARAGIPIADLAGSLWAAIAILSAIIRRANGFAGPQLIDTSLLDGQIALLPYFAAYYLNGGFLAGPQGSGGHSPTYGAYQCGDGQYLVIAVIDQKPWELLCGALGRPDLLTDERFGSAHLRIEHTDELRGILEAHFRTQHRGYFLDRLSAAGIPSGPVNNLAEALAEPQVLARDMVVQVPFGEAGEVSLTGTPVRLSGFSPDYRTSPTPGSDSDPIRDEFGLVWRPAP
jgi:CoA:oxalate CoA-transferase